MSHENPTLVSPDFATSYLRASGHAWPKKTVLRTLSEMRKGHLRMELPDRNVLLFGERNPATTALPTGIRSSGLIRVRNDAFFKKCLLYGDIGFAESYLDGDWDTPDLTAVIAWFILNLENAATLSGSSRSRTLTLNLLRFANRTAHLLRPNSTKNARRNISEHYDLSNAFFELILGSSMMYSSAKWPDPSATLAEAQREKNDALCRKLKLAASDHVLEIGSGWGSWAIHAASIYGCRVTTLTLSEEQQKYAREKIDAAGLAHLIKVELRDYRHVEGQFDKIVSIEMMEAIGHRYLPDFCSALGRTLKQGGIAALQFITCPDERYDEFRRGVDFIQKHIFPGSLLLSLNRVNHLASQKAGLLLHELEDLGHDYARTLKIWNETLHAKEAQVRALGFDDRFLRKWTYYFSYCEAAFAMRNISVVQAVYTRPNNLAL